MPILKNSRHEKFAQLVASGTSDLQAYVDALGTTYSTAQKNAHRLKENEGVAERILELQEKSSEECRISRKKLMDFLADVIEIGAGKVHKTDRLCQGFKDTDDIHEIRMPDKLSAASQLSKMCGWDAPGKVELGPSNELTELLKRLRGSG